MKRNYSKTLHATFSLIFGAMLATFVAGAADSQLEGENILQVLPKDFEVANQQSPNHITLTEMIPKGETVDHWTQMVTTQIFHGIDDPAFYPYYKKQTGDRFEQACDVSNSESFTELDGEENGYPVHLWLASCKFKNPRQAPEITLFKFIQGNDAAYVVQLATHYEPTDEQMNESMKYLAKVLVCDTRRKESPCSMPSPSSSNADAPAQDGVAEHKVSIGDANAHGIPCLSMQDVKNTYTPFDLIASFAQCADEGDYDKAARLYITANSYTKFDIARVADPSVGDMRTIVALRMASYMSETQRKTFDEALHAITDNETPLNAFCAQIRRLGPPSYYPDYLIAHGMNGFLDESTRGAALKADFNARETWNSLEKDFVRCKS
ncbi:hypothetical protein [Dyella acidisoli]|uniref:Uncharacterized protein n=1 Tax=Dyella acidisoli TaxID=1867834 RepID=A0ABQ5XR35_9GAMM|nr:hypothetical protein [Dyella acidisoli]GLQ93036.1 hypothetical protein GCM10007901_19870 [Dyella acidisoli]